MEFSQLLTYLQTIEEFQEMGAWEIIAISMGTTSHNTYRFLNNKKDYFVKEISALERNALSLLYQHKLSIVPKVHHPELLEYSVLVTDYISGGCFRKSRLPQTLIRDYATMQNILNKAEILAKENPYNYCKSNNKDDGTFRRTITECETDCRANLERVKAYALPITDAYEQLFAFFSANRAAIAAEYAHMPFGWLHNDFRADNIVGEPPVIIDWGSSYGHGPFLHDLAPFLLKDETGLRDFIKYSENCKATDEQKIRQWLVTAGWARFVAFVRWHMEEGVFWHNREECDKYLTKEYPIWRVLEMQKM